MGWKALASKLLMGYSVAFGLFFAILVGVFAWPDIQQAWINHEAALRTEQQESARRDEDQKRAKLLSVIGETATVTADALLDAQRGCAVIGVPDIDQCATYVGPLPQEQASQAGAKTAVERRATYMGQCQQLYPDGEYCWSLLSRAVDIAQRQRKAKRE